MIELLGSTFDPTAIVPGDPDTVEADAQALKASARELDEIASALQRMDVDGWSGRAADAFAESVDARRRHVLSAADAMDGAASALTDYASMLRWAQRRASAAIATWAEGDRVAVANPGLGLEAQHHAEARSIAHEAITPVQRAGDDAARTLQEISVDQPYRPTVWNEIGYLASEIPVGARDSFASLGSLLRAGGDPVHRRELQQQTGEGLVAGAIDPRGFQRALIDADTLEESPGRWLGGFAPDALGGVLTGGAGAVAAGSLRGATAGARLADDAAGAALVMGGRRADNLAGATGSVARTVDDAGQWTPVREAMSDRAADYQAQITGREGLLHE